MRQIKSFINSVLLLMKIGEFYISNKSNARSYKLKINLIEMKMFGTNSRSITVSHTNGNVLHFVNDDISKKNTVTVSVRKFGSSKLENSHIDLDIEDKTDYFNQLVLNDPGMITLEDVKVLKEIFVLALKVLNNETTVHELS